MTTFEIGGQTISKEDPRLPGVLAQLHEKKVRPLCLCRNPGIPMYIAKNAGSFIVKRMPNTGAKHGTECDSFEPPEELSGLGQVMGSAIKENVDDGTTTIKLEFSLSKGATRAAPLPTGKEKDSVKTDGSKLTLRGTLHYLWEEAGFNKWSPAMEGKRNWSTIRKYLLQAAANKFTKGGGLLDILYIPESFSTDRKDEIERRRMAQMMKLASDDKKRQLGILIGEVKELAPARYGHKMVVKHMPNTNFMMNPDMYERILKRFHHELELQTIDNSMLLAIGTFSVSSAGIPTLEEAALINVNENWIPFENKLEYDLLQELVKKKRRFVKSLRYNMSQDKPLAAAVLTDRPEGIEAIYIEPANPTEGYSKALQDLIAESDVPAIVWHAGEEGMPEIK